MEDTPNGETGTPKAPENNAGTTSTSNVTTTSTVDSTEVEKLRKEKEQAEMRANQLQNQLKSKEEAEAKLKSKELEEQNKFNELYEQEKAKYEALETEVENEKKAKELSDAKKTVLSDYPDEVKTLADEAGMTLTDSDEASVTSFKEKLDKIAKLVNATSKVTPNNPNRAEQKVQLNTEELRRALKNDQAFHELLMQRPGIAVMANRRNVPES
jgi:glutamate-1-semialdehyde aminotransferase